MSCELVNILDNKDRVIKLFGSKADWPLEEIVMLAHGYDPTFYKGDLNIDTSHKLYRDYRTCISASESKNEDEYLTLVPLSKLIDRGATNKFEVKARIFFKWAENRWKYKSDVLKMCEFYKEYRKNKDKLIKVTPIKSNNAYLVGEASDKLQVELYKRYLNADYDELLMPPQKGFKINITKLAKKLSLSFKHIKLLTVKKYVRRLTSQEIEKIIENEI